MHQPNKHREALARLQLQDYRSTKPIEWLYQPKLVIGAGGKQHLSIIVQVQVVSNTCSLQQQRTVSCYRMVRLLSSLSKQYAYGCSKMNDLLAYHLNYYLESFNGSCCPRIQLHYQQTKAQLLCSGWCRRDDNQQLLPTPSVSTTIRLHNE